MKRNKNVIATILLIVVLFTTFIITSRSYYTLEKDSCFHTLTEYTSMVGHEIRNNLKRDQEHLEMISEIISGYESVCSDNAQEILTAFGKCGMVSRLEILLPDNRVLLSDGKLIDVSGKMSFEEVAALGSHLSSREFDLTDPDKAILRSFVPIKKDGVTIAMLSGVIDLDQLSALYTIDAFDGNTQVYMIDAKSGDFLLDTWHDSLTNLQELGERPVKFGYSIEKMTSDMFQGLKGSIVFRSQTANEYFYCYYEPAGIGQWMLMLSVPEDIVFGKLYTVMILSCYLAAVEICAFIIYFMWTFITLKRDNFEKESQLGRVQYMFDIEKILFDAHMRPEQINEALQKIAGVTTAEKAFLFITGGEVSKHTYFWTAAGDGAAQFDNADRQKLWKCVSTMGVLCDEKKSLLSNDLETLKPQSPEQYEMLRLMEIKSIMATPIIGIDGELTGILGVCDMKHLWQNAQLLECVSLTFSMAINNIHVHRTVQKMGVIDSLTGLLNRNSYHAALANIEKNSYHSIACVFIDVNGLHEINNHLGHEAGDKMLQFIASELKIHFGTGDTYRIGGDEFVAICKNQPKEEVEKKEFSVKRAVSLNHYQISSGIEWRDSDFNINAIIKAAEQKMQEDKRTYYQKKGDLRKIREMNHQLEKILAEKQDADAFLSVIATNFKGVYFVNLSSDTVRHIFIPPYFEDMLNQTGGKFSKAILLYSQEKVAPDFCRQFNEFCGYEHLFKQLEDNIVPVFIYQKTDGSCLRLRVFKFKRYTDENKETLWIFEDAKQSKNSKLRRTPGELSIAD